MNESNRLSREAGGGNGSVPRGSKTSLIFLDSTAFSAGEFAGNPALSMFTPGVARVPRWKRILDVTCIVVSAIFWLPTMILVMGWIRLTSPGPIFYRQERVGYRQRRFMLFKFRTMQLNAETRTHEEYFARLMQEKCPMTKLDAVGDSRLIPGGRFLRASGLDELPQLFNILRGEMSLVGPRPCIPTEFVRYEPWQKRRLETLPGLTGYWQVNGKNSRTFHEMILLDLLYIRKMSLRLDLAIMLKTIPTLTREILKSRRGSPAKLEPTIGHGSLHLTESLNSAAKKR